MTEDIHQVASTVSTQEDRRQLGDKGMQVELLAIQPSAPQSVAQVIEAHTIVTHTIVCQKITAITVTENITQTLFHSADPGLDPGTGIMTIMDVALTQVTTVPTIAATLEA